MGKQRISIMSFNLPLHLFSLCRFHFKTSIASCIKQIDASAVHEFEPCYVQLCSATEVQYIINENIPTIHVYRQVSLSIGQGLMLLWSCKRVDGFTEALTNSKKIINNKKEPNKQTNRKKKYVTVI